MAATGDNGDGHPTIIIIPPLFDEANRMRRTLVLMMHALAERGHASILPDLPGQNDSMMPTQQATLSQWRGALASIAASRREAVLVASWRGGALIDDAATGAIGWWRMAPQAGASIVKTLMRARMASERESGQPATLDSLRAMAQAGSIALAGNRLSASMIAELEAAQPAAVSPLRLATLGDAEGQVAGSPLWLRAEPGEDAAMATAMAGDIARWAGQCVAG